MHTRYTHSTDGVRIAYQVHGQGEIDILLVPGMGSHIELHWCEPNYAAFMKHLCRLGRLIVFDKRGTGCSDRIEGIPTMEQRMRDLQAVLDAAGSERAVILGISEGAALASLYAASRPSRALGLILCSSFPTGKAQGDYLGAVRPDKLPLARRIWSQWGSGRAYEIYAPGLLGNIVHRFLLGIGERASASSQTMAALVDAMFEIDIRHILPQVHVPALMFHRREEIAPVESARQMAELMPHCEWVELDGDEHVPFAGSGAPTVRDRIGDFLRSLGEQQADRALATVMFSDIVDSTQQAAALGDRDWLALLDRHDAAVRDCLARHQGRELKNLGDGFFMLFDGPVGAIQCAADIVRRTQQLGLAVRVGIHSGELSLSAGEARGLAVHVGARISASAQGGEIRVSDAVRDLSVGSGLEFERLAPERFKGLDGEWPVCRVQLCSTSPDPVASVRSWPERLGAFDRLMVWFACAMPWLIRWTMRRTQGRRSQPWPAA